MDEITDAATDRQALILLAAHFSNAPEITSQMTVAELNKLWSSMAKGFYRMEFEAVDAVRDGLPSSEAGERARALLWIVQEFRLEGETLRSQGMFNEAEEP